MNLLLRPLDDVTDVTWSIIISIILVLIGTAYYIYTIMKLAYEELDENQLGETVENSATNDNGRTVSDSMCDSSESHLP